jgi:heme/copper-type cytochrome/quinol oxidase subunit 2
MAKRTYSSLNDPQADEKLQQFRQNLDKEIDHAIEGHETKMVYIGFVTLFVFATVIYSAWKF